MMTQKLLTERILAYLILHKNNRSLELWLEEGKAFFVSIETSSEIKDSSVLESLYIHISMGVLAAVLASCVHSS